MSQLKQQILALDESLSGFKSADLPNGASVKWVGLLAQARETARRPSHQIHSRLQAQKHDKMFVADAKIGTIRATLRQAAEALPDDLDRLKAQRQRRLSAARAKRPRPIVV